MNAVVANVPAPIERYPGKTPELKARLIRAEMQLSTRFLRAGLLAVAWRCHVCGGRVDIKGRSEIEGRAMVIKTTGKCRTPGCLDWED